VNELEARLIYAVIVAGKSADFADQVCYALWDMIPDGMTPFEWFRAIGPEGVLAALKEAHTGNYGKNSRCLDALANCPLLDLRTVSPEQLEQFHGIGPKTSRFFILWTRPGEKLACLDVHILRWLRTKGYDAPERTPRGQRYYELEEAFIREAEALGMTPRQLDYAIWCVASGRTQEGAGYE